MKNIGIITLHNVVNYGSILQTYALQETIKKMGARPTIIDYYPKRLKIGGMLSRLKNKSKKLSNPIINLIAKCIIFPSYIDRFSIFKKFKSKKLLLTKKTYYKENDLNNEKFCFDGFCTGSDQVWNSSWNEGIDKPFYLTFTEKPKFAYAASFGKSKISDEEQEKIKPYLSQYFSISTREDSGVNILKNMGLKGEHVLDPTFLLNGEEWSRLASEKYAKKKYILMYNLNRNKKMWNIAKEISKKYNVKLIYISYSYHEFFKYGKMACNKKVEDFLSLIKNAEFVLTDSFHATAFSLNFNKDFYVIYPEKFSSRLQSVLEKTNLTTRIIEDANQIEFSNHIDYSIVNQIINNERKNSFDYLEKCIEVINNGE